MMSETHVHETGARLTLDSQLADLTLVWPWVDALALQYAISDQTKFAVSLCLEEALSNIIRHGHSCMPNHPITVDCAPNGESWLMFIVEDSAPPFAPSESLTPNPAAAPASIEDVTPGGQGIILMRRFADTLAWERLPNGNRLTLGFQIASPALAAS
jgi:anti-sigma regulatory factor (Ser/Thr protein kinase)